MLQKRLFLIINFFILNFLFSQNHSLYFVTEDNLNDFENTYIIQYNDSLYQNIIKTDILNTKLINIKIPDTLNCIYLLISHLNYNQIKKKVCINDKLSDTVFLYNKTNQLDEIILKATKNTKISLKGNVVEIIPGKIIEKASVDLNSFFKIIPDVFVFPDGNIKIRGQSIKGLYLHSSSIAPGIEISSEEFKSLSISSIEKINALYSEREIHIYLKKLKTGYKLQDKITLNQGKLFYISNNFNFSFNNKNTSVWTNNNFGNIKQIYISDGKYLTLLNNQNQLLNNHSDFTNYSKYINTSALIEQKIDSTSVLGFNFNFKYNDNDNKNIFISNNLNHIINSYSYDYKIINRFSVLISYKYKISKQWDFSIKAGYLISNHNDANNSQFEYNLDSNLYTGNDYFKQDNKFEVFSNECALEKSISTKFGLKFLVKNDNIKTISNNNTFVNSINYSLSDTSFVNKLSENKWKIESQFKFKIFKKGDLVFSPNFIFYKYSHRDVQSSNIIEQKYNIFTPNINLTFTLKNNKNLSFFANRSFNDVNLINLIYSKKTIDGFTVNENNLELKPAIYEQFGVSYGFTSYLNNSFYLIRGHNTFLNYPLFSDENAFIGNNKINVDRNNVLATNISFSKTIGEKLFISSNLIINYNHLSANKDYLFDFEFFGSSMNLSIYYDFNNKTNISFDYNLLSKQKISENIGLKSWSVLNVNFTRDLSKYFVFELNLNDILNTYKLNLYNLQEKIKYETYSSFDFRYISLGIKFKFNKGFKTKQQTDNLMENFNEKLKL